MVPNVSCFDIRSLLIVLEKPYDSSLKSLNAFVGQYFEIVSYYYVHCVQAGRAKTGLSKHLPNSDPVTGSIRHRSPGAWELTVDLGRDAAGRRRRKYLTAVSITSDI